MKLLCIVDSYFPFGAAISGRVNSFCEMFSKMGYLVHVVAQYTKKQDIEVGKIYSINDYTYQIASVREPSFIDTYVSDKSFKKIIVDCLVKNDYDIVFSLSCSMYFSMIRRLTLNKRIPYFIEQCEWQDISNYRFGQLDPRYKRIVYLRSKGYKQADGIIAISKLLELHYKKQGIRTIRIPTILDVKSINPKLTMPVETKISIVYTGNPGKSKEFLKPIIECLSMNPHIREKIDFHIYGPNKKTVIDNIGQDELLERAGESVVIHGYVPQEKIKDIIADAHFQIFVRPKRRSSDAGFPTKLGESMTVGTPVITNETGDICDYLRDGINGFLLHGNETQDVKFAMERIISLNPSDYYQLRINARKTAERWFDYRNYMNDIKTLFDGCSNLGEN